MRGARSLVLVPVLAILVIAAVKAEFSPPVVLHLAHMAHHAAAQWQPGHGKAKGGLKLLGHLLRLFRPRGFRWLTGGNGGGWRNNGQ